MSTERSVQTLVDELTLREKVSLVHGSVDPEGRATGYVEGVERLDIPPLRLVDGPLGTRIPGERSTAFPAPIALAATFDANLAREHGAALGRETKGKGQDGLLAPGVNLIRVPHNGRNFEYFSEDPVHSAVIGASVTAGIQSEDVVATPKHYVANNQETYRASTSAEVEERALRELYLPSFHDAIEAGAGSVMTAYNSVNGTRMSDHRYLLRKVLKEEWGFDGYVVSDWWGTELAADAANGGLDLEMPGVTLGEFQSILQGDGSETDGDDRNEGESEGFEMPEEIARGMPDPETCEHFADRLAAEVEAGTVSEARLDDMVTRVLGQMSSVGLLDGTRSGGAVDTDAHRTLAERVAARGTVLLENDGVLPLNDDTNVAVIGPNVDEALLGGGGSSETTPFTEVSPREGITARADGSVSVEYGIPPVEDLSLFDALEVESEEKPPEREPDIEGAVTAARDSDVAVVFVRDAVTEAIDREDLRLPGRQDELVEAVAEANDRTVVVINSSGPVETPWREDVAAIVENWYPGQSHGDALAAVLYGDVDAGGRLPVTFAPEEAYPFAEERNFPGVDGEVHHEEGIFVGYRHFDASDAEPTYPFGHGHSYADFEYVAAELDGDAVSVTVRNTAGRDGREVIQVYVRPPEVADVARPARELAGFESVPISAGETKTVEIELDERAFQRYDEEDGWTTDSGEYNIEIARSSREVEVELTDER